MGESQGERVREQGVKVWQLAGRRGDGVPGTIGREQGRAAGEQKPRREPRKEIKRLRGRTISVGRRCPVFSSSCGKVIEQFQGGNETENLVMGPNLGGKKNPGGRTLPIPSSCMSEEKAARRAAKPEDLGRSRTTAWQST